MTETDAPQGEPRGIVMCFIAPDGHVVATATDFALDGYGGFSLQEAQTLRCKNRLAYAVANAFCHPSIVKAQDDYRWAQVLQDMERDQNYRRHTIIIGHEDSNDND